MQTLPLSPPTIQPQSPLSPPPSPLCCDWEEEQCHMMAPDDAPPVQCQRRGCHKHAHHVCANKWLEANNFADKTVSLTLCREHHPQYYLMNVLLKPPPTIPPPLDNEATATAASAKPDTSSLLQKDPSILNGPRNFVICH